MQRSRSPSPSFRDTNFPRIVIGVDNGVMPVEQMQVSITKPIEDAVNSIPGLVTIRSTTSRGSAEISLFFEWGVDMDLTLQRTDAAVARMQQELPSTVKLVDHKLNFATFPILGYALTADTTASGQPAVPLTALWELATYELRPPLNRVTGVSTVIIQGGQVPEFHIVPNVSRLQTAGVTMTDLVTSVQASNIIDSPGLYEANHQLILGLVGAQAHDASQLGALIVKTTAAGVPVRVSDLADVVPATMPIYTTVTSNGGPAVLLNIIRQPTSNTVDVANDIEAEVATLQSKLPPGVHLKPFYDQSEIVRQSIASVRDAILIGLVLACIVLFLFLRDWTSSLVAGLVIPVTVAITILFLWAIGQSFNLMTLGGLAAAIGLVIDDAIVVVENIVVHRDRGELRLHAVRLTLEDITAPLVYSTITPVVVFLPLISVTGVTGSFFRALAVTMTAALLTSLALALTWTPALSLFILRKPNPRHQPLSSHGHEPFPVLNRLFAAHARSLQWSVAHPLLLALICLVLTVGTYFGYNALGTDLLPRMDEGAFILDYFTPAGTSLTETNRILAHVEQILHNTPEVDITSRRTGLQLGIAPVTEANRGDFTVRLKTKRSRNVEEIISDIREKIRTSEPSLDIDFPQVLQDMIGDLSNQPEDIVIKLFSPDAALINELGPRVQATISKIPSVVDTKNGVEDTISGPATNFQVDPITAGRLGFTPAEVAEDATSILDGLPTTDPMIVNGRPYTIRVRLPAENRASLEAIQNTVFNSSTGKTATLGALASIQQLPPQNEILRENLQRLIVVTGRLEGSDLGTVMKQVRADVAAMHLPSSVRVEYGGVYQEQQKSFHDLALVLLMALVLVFGVVLTEFRNFAAPVAILVSSILSVSGVILALLITQTSFNVASFMGLIMVIGIVAKNGILLLDADEKFHAQHELSTENTERSEQAEERDLCMEAMLHAAQRRLRPIVMTAIAAICGMLPLAFALGAGSQMLQPLAISVIGGLIVSVFLSLIVTPVLYYRLTRDRHSA